MTKTKKNKFTVDVKIIKELENLSGLKQKEVPDKMGELGLKMSLRSYQRILDYKFKHTEEAINTVALFYGKYLQSKNIERIITFKDLVLEKIKDKKTESKTSKDPLKTEFEEETIFLNRITSYRVLEGIIRLGQKRKIFYPQLPNQKQMASIKTTLIYITKIFEEYNRSGSKISKFVDTESYSQIDTELYQLESFSTFSNVITELNDNDIQLYAGNYKLYNIKTVTKRSGDQLICKALPVPTNYSIYCFDKSRSFSKTLSYKNPYFKRKLEAILKAYPMDDLVVPASQEDEYTVNAFDNDLVNQYYGFDETDDAVIGEYNSFDRDRASIYATSISEINNEQNKKLIKGT